jgi:hypothetical protein
MGPQRRPSGPVSSAPPVNRIGFLLSQISRSARIIEIGPSYNPIAPKADGWNTTTVDHGSRAELIAKYGKNPNVKVERIEEVDCVWNNGPLIDAVPRQHHGMFDLLIASHVIEHTTDLLGFLDAAQTLLSPSGIVALAVPDKRYCFDYFRPWTTTGQILQAHATVRSRHTRRIIFDHVAYTVRAKHGNGADWSGAWGQALVRELEFLHAPALDSAKARFAEVSEDPASPYVDSHAWQFTPASFELIILELARMGESDWQIQQMTPASGAEFCVRLERGGKTAARALSMAELDAKRLALLKRSLLETQDQLNFLLAG